MVQQVDDGILNSNLGQVGELEGIQVRTDLRPALLQDESLQGLHDMRHKCHRLVVRETTGLWRLWDWNEAGRLPYHRDPLEAQAHVEDMVKNSTELFASGSENPWADTIRACSLTSREFAQLSPYMKRCKQCRLSRGRIEVHNERRAGSKGARRGVRSGGWVLGAQSWMRCYQEGEGRSEVVVAGDSQQERQQVPELQCQTC